MDYNGFEDRDSYIAWFKSLKKGDLVCYSNGWRVLKPYTITSVERVTPAGWVKTVNGLTFVDGEERGKRGTWDSRRDLIPVTDEIRKKDHEYRLRSYFQSLTYIEFTYEELVQISNFITSLKEGK